MEALARRLFDVLEEIRFVAAIGIAVRAKYGVRSKVVRRELDFLARLARAYIKR